jgi:hypothetical protein
MAVPIAPRQNPNQPTLEGSVTVRHARHRPGILAARTNEPLFPGESLAPDGVVPTRQRSNRGRWSPGPQFALWASRVAGSSRRPLSADLRPTDVSAALSFARRSSRDADVEASLSSATGSGIVVMPATPAVGRPETGSKPAAVAASGSRRGGAKSQPAAVVINSRNLAPMSALFTNLPPLFDEPAVSAARNSRQLRSRQLEHRPV